LSNTMAEYRKVYNAAQQIEDSSERRRAVAVASREMRYFADRLRTAQLVPPPADFSAVAFGHRVTAGAKPSESSGKTKRILGMDQFLTSPRSLGL